MIESAEQKEHARWLEQLRRTLKSNHGREVLYTLLDRTGIFRQSWSPGEHDTTAFAEGRRSIGLQLFLEMLDASPDLYMQCIKEMKERSERHEPNDDAGE